MTDENNQNHGPGWLEQEPRWRRLLMQDLATAAGGWYDRDQMDEALIMLSTPAIHKHVLNPGMWVKGPLAAVHERIASGALGTRELERLLVTAPAFQPPQDLCATAHSAEAIAAVARGLEQADLVGPDSGLHALSCYTGDDWRTLTGQCNCLEQAALVVLDSLAQAPGSGYGAQQTKIDETTTDEEN